MSPVDRDVLSDEEMPEPVLKARKLAIEISDLVSDQAERDLGGNPITAVMAQLTALLASLMVLEEMAPLPRGLAEVKDVVTRAAKGIMRAVCLREKKKRDAAHHGRPN